MTRRPIGMRLDDWAEQLEAENDELREKLCAALSQRRSEPPPGYRSTDPGTSRAAWELNEKTIKTQRGRTLDTYMQARRPMTWKDVEQSAGVRGAWKRVSELAKLGYLEDTGLVRDGCRVFRLVETADA